MSEIKPPDLEVLVGMTSYLSKTPGIGGFLKVCPEDFIVEEINPDGLVLEYGKDQGFELGERREYLHFTLEKNNWDTMRAIKTISKRLRVGHKRFGFAGTKDKKAVSTQRVSVWDTDAEALGKVNIRDIVLRDFSYENERITLGDLQGNRFHVTVRGLEDIPRERIESIASELEGKAPNFFGLQRFGVARPITHVVGKKILERDFEGAVMTYIAEVFEEENEEARNARAAFKESGDIRAALKDYPKYLGYERSMLDHLLHTPTDFIGALRELPKKLRWMFIHAYQGYVFNQALSCYLEKGECPSELPLVGHASSPDPVTQGILEKEGLSLSDFKVNEMPEASSEGIMRDCFFSFEDFSVSDMGPDELLEGKEKAVLEFSLPKGSYATTLLREFLKNEYWQTRFI